jgi:hypothetical protein
LKKELVIENVRVICWIVPTKYLLLLDNLAVILGFLALKDKYNICTLSENKKFICTCCTTGQKNLPKAV